MPVIEPGATQVLVVDGETELADQVQGGAGRRTQPGDITCVGRDLRLDQDDMEVGWLHGCGS